MAASKLHRAALYYAKMGWPVFPLKPSGKVPITANGVHAATTDRAQVNQWWSDRPGANVALATGALIAIDLDVKPERAINGVIIWEEMNVGEDGALVNLTPTGGKHLIWRCPPRVTIGNSAGTIGLGIDVRGKGGYIVLPPSIHPNGKPYVWELSAHPSEQRAGILPPDIVAMLQVKSTGPAPEAPEQIQDGKRNQTLASLAGSMRRRGLTAAEIFPSLMAVNQGRCKPPLSKREITRICESVARYKPKARAASPPPPPDETPHQVAVRQNGGNRNHWSGQYGERWGRMRNG